ncbi:hypothetical protein BIY24_02110 [Halobacteriovorax marinus]|uniref:S9 family peptidase n=1 Tax=Halobacteriovorax marinus TaxID=97084 RepID=UPI000BC3336B|nr:S9 family peptidase [Halobacteriovorax marinus]ATH06775.1 hypothetical protein BIY24_02110 [Halobacteriovorax marinus]
MTKKINHELTSHGETRVDEYYWMRNLESDGDVRQFLNSNNDQLSTFLSDTSTLQEELYKEMRGRKKEVDETVPAKDGEYFYYNRYIAGGEYPIYCRKLGMNGKEEILLDGNKLAEGKEYLDIGAYSISPNNKLMAYTIDEEGDEVYKLYIKDLEKDSLYDEVIDNVYSSICWFNDSEHLCYNVLNDKLRPYEVRLHKLTTTPSEDTILYTEESGEYFVHCSKSNDKEFIFFISAGSISSEYSYISANAPKAAVSLVSKRAENYEYDVDHYNGEFFILTNDEHQNFRLVKCPVDKCSKDNWEEVIAGSDEQYLLNYESFKDFAVLTLRENGLKKFQVIHHDSGKVDSIDFPQKAYSVSEDDNFEYDTSKFRMSYSALNTPWSVIEYDIHTKNIETLKVQEIPNFKSEDYIVERLSISVRDKSEVPVSVIRRKGVELDGKSPLFVYGYGSYGYSIEPGFRDDYLSLIERGFNFAIIHPRGSSTLGRSWYEDGKFLKKKNTFFDFVDCTESLCQLGYSSRGNVFAMGGSAGGLLMGAITNLAPDLYKTIVAQVPFVDVLTTMLDKDLPLTELEYKEWGNPEDREYYDYIKSYSPYDNLAEVHYPNILATAGLNDPRVTYWEPAKWVERIRNRNTGNSQVHFYTNMDAGHGGASGRFEYLKEEAMVFAFVLKTFNLV